MGCGFALEENFGESYPNSFRLFTFPTSCMSWLSDRQPAYVVKHRKIANMMIYMRCHAWPVSRSVCRCREITFSIYVW